MPIIKYILAEIWAAIIFTDGWTSIDNYKLRIALSSTFYCDVDTVYECYYDEQQLPGVIYRHRFHMMTSLDIFPILVYLSNQTDKE